MDPSKLILIALKFNERINLQDAKGLANLMTDDHKFIDSVGNVTEGRGLMEENWRKFFESYPDYKNHFTTVAVQENVVVMLGRSVCSNKKLAGPSVWTARIRGKRVAEWRVSWLDER
jgi:ketosteroid isomerase-like protein